MELLKKSLTCLVENKDIQCQEGCYDFTIDGADFKVEEQGENVQIVWNVDNIKLSIPTKRIKTNCLHRHRLSSLLLLYEVYMAKERTEKANLVCESMEILFEKMTESDAMRETRQYLNNCTLLEPCLQVDNLYLSIPSSKLKLMIKLYITLDLLSENLSDDVFFDRYENFRHIEELIELFHLTQTGPHFDGLFLVSLLLVFSRTNKREITCISDATQNVIQKMSETNVYSVISSCLKNCKEQEIEKIQSLNVFQTNSKFRFILTLCISDKLLANCRDNEEKFCAFKNSGNIAKLTCMFQITDLDKIFFLSSFLITRYLIILLQVFILDRRSHKKLLPSSEADTQSKELSMMIDSLASVMIPREEDEIYCAIDNYLKHHMMMRSYELRGLRISETNSWLAILFKLCMTERLLDQYTEEECDFRILKNSDIILELIALHSHFGEFFFSSFLKQRYLAILLKISFMESNSNQERHTSQETQTTEKSIIRGLIEKIMPKLEEWEICGTISNYWIEDVSRIPVHLKNLSIFKSDSRIGLILNLCITEILLSRKGMDCSYASEKCINILELTSMYQSAHEKNILSEFLKARFLVISLKLCFTEQYSPQKQLVSSESQFKGAQMPILNALIGRIMPELSEKMVYLLICDFFKRHTDVLQSTFLQTLINSNLKFIITLCLIEQLLDQGKDDGGTSSAFENTKNIKMLYQLYKKTKNEGFLQKKYVEVMLKLLVIEISSQNHKLTLTEMAENVVRQACGSMQEVLLNYEEEDIYQIFHSSLKSCMHMETIGQVKSFCIFENSKMEFMLQLLFTEILFEHQEFSNAFDSTEDLISLYISCDFQPSSWLGHFSENKLFGVLLQYYITFNCRCHASHVLRPTEKYDLITDYLESLLQDFQEEAFITLGNHLYSHGDDLQVNDCNLYKNESNFELKFILHLAMVENSGERKFGETEKIESLIKLNHSVKWRTNSFYYSRQIYFCKLLNIFLEERFSDEDSPVSFTKPTTKMVLVSNSLETMIKVISETHSFDFIRKYLDRYSTVDLNSIFNNLNVFEPDSKLEYILKLCLAEKIIDERLYLKDHSNTCKRMWYYLISSDKLVTFDGFVQGKYVKLTCTFPHECISKDSEIKESDIRKHLSLDKKQQELWLKCKQIDVDLDSKKQLKDLILQNFLCKNISFSPESSTFKHKYIGILKKLFLKMAELVSVKQTLLKIFVELLAYFLQQVAMPSTEKIKFLGIEIFADSLKTVLRGDNQQKIIEVIQVLSQTKMSNEVSENMSVQLCIHLLYHHKRDYQEIAINILNVFLSNPSQNSERFLLDMIYKLIGFPSSSLIYNSMNSLEVKKQIFQKTLTTMTDSSECELVQYHFLQNILSKIERKWHSVQENYAKREHHIAMETRKKLKQSAMSTILVFQMVIVSSNGEHKSAKLKKYLVLKYEYDKSILYLLWCSGDIEINPGPPVKRNLLTYDSEKVRRWTQEMASNLLKSYWGFHPRTKQKNLWKKKPDEWPESIPFYDTKNKKRDGNRQTISDKDLVTYLKECCDKKGVSLNESFKEELTAWNDDKRHLVFKMHTLRLECHKIISALQEIKCYTKSDDLKNILKDQRVLLNIHPGTQCSSFSSLYSKKEINITREIAILLCKICHRRKIEDKCEGIWDEPLDDWPHDVRLFDPNNRAKYKKKYPNQKLCSDRQLTDTFLRLPTVKTKMTMPEYKMYQSLIDAYQVMIHSSEGRDKKENKENIQKLFSIYMNTTKLDISLKNLHEAGLFDKEVHLILTSWWTSHKIDPTDDYKLSCTEITGKRPHVLIDLHQDFLQISVCDCEPENNSNSPVSYNIPLNALDGISSSSTNYMLHSVSQRNLCIAASRSNSQQSTLRPQSYPAFDSNNQTNSVTSYKPLSCNIDRQQWETDNLNSESISTHCRSTNFSLSSTELQNSSNDFNIEKINSKVQETNVNVGNIPLLVWDTEDIKPVNLNTKPADLTTESNINKIKADYGQPAFAFNHVKDQKDINTETTNSLGHGDEASYHENDSNSYQGSSRKVPHPKLTAKWSSSKSHKNQENSTASNLGQDQVKKTQETGKRKSSVEEDKFSTCNKKLKPVKDNENAESFTTWDWDQVIQDLNSDLTAESNINPPLLNTGNENLFHSIESEQIYQDLENFVTDLINYESGLDSTMDKLLADQT